MFKKNFFTTLRYLCLFLFLFMLMPTYARGDPWAEAIHLNNNWIINSVEQTLDGGFVVVGHNEYFGIGSNVHFVRLNSSGKLQWVKTYGAGYHPFNVNMTLQTADGAFIMAGVLFDYSSSNRREDALLVKLDAAGRILWQKTYGTSANEKTSAIIQASDGGFFLLGTSARPKNSDAWCMKLSSDGNILWQKTYGNNNSKQSLGNAVATRDGGVIFVGSTEEIKGGSLPWVVKLNKNGHIVWQKTLSVGTGESVAVVTTTVDGGYIVASAVSATEGWVAKLGAKGALSWETGLRYGQTGTAGELLALREEKDGHILVMGNILDEIWSIRLDSSGKIFSKKAYGESRATRRIALSTIHDTSNDGTIFAGSRMGTRQGVPFNDGFIARSSSRGSVCSALKESVEIESHQLSVTAKQAHVATRENNFGMRTIDWVFEWRGPVSVKITNLCAGK